jgi:hypothetical protein
LNTWSSGRDMMRITTAGRHITSSMHELKWWNSIARTQEQLNRSMLLSLTPSLSLELTWWLIGDSHMSWCPAFEGGGDVRGHLSLSYFYLTLPLSICIPHSLCRYLTTSVSHRPPWDAWHSPLIFQPSTIWSS